MNNPLRLAVITLLLAVPNLSAATLYVSLESTNPTPPFTNWITAATNIQQAVGAAAAGDVVVVTNGVYSGRVVVNKPLALQSVNGPQFTVINGGGTNQCASLTNGASLSGFTLTNGLYGGKGAGVWCASTNTFLTNCTLTGNSSGWDGGGVSGGTLYNCTLTGNSGSYGGGASGGTLYNCTLTCNSRGGAYGCTLYNCTLTANSATHGSGVSGGASQSTLYNCIVYFNTGPDAGNYDTNSILNYCCTTPLPPSGTGNIALDPQLASASHLSAASPCRGAGSAAYATGTDIDGEAWGNPPSIGCDEYHAGAVTGPLTVNLKASYTNVAAGYPVSLTALIEGRTTESAWEFGDGDVAVNQPYITHGWTEPGDYLVALWAFNECQPGGVSATVTIHVAAGVLYVAATSTNPQPPFATWATAATDIQQAVDAAAAAGVVVVVTNGVYAGGVAVTNLLTLRSANGPQVTVIDGGGTTRCVSLTNGASLSGFTLTNGWAADYGGGVLFASTTSFITNCTLTGNSASAGGGAAGFWSYGTLYNCTLTNNSDFLCGAPVCNGGGGAFRCTLYNCTLTGNSSVIRGGGADSCRLVNCTLTRNTRNPAATYGNGAMESTLYNCIVFNDTVEYSDVYTNDPLFVDYANGNLRLQSNSPCINAGNNAYVTTATDLDGRPRIVGGTVDMGAYEFQPGVSGAFIGWLQQYGLPTDGSADYADPDHDGMNNWQEWICGTDPTNPLSVLRLLSPSITSTNATVRWQSVAGVSYFVERSENLDSPCMPLATNIVGQAGTTSYADTNATGAGPFFYRVGVGN